MTEQKQPNTLADRALTRLRQLATGNGLEPAAINVIEKQEQDFVINGIMEISPLCEIETITYPGSVRGKDRKSVASYAALQEAVVKHQQTFRENPDWVSDATKEIKTHDGQGWGLEDAKVTLPLKSAVYAASQNCPSCGGRQLLTCTQCNGQGTVTCTQCQGNGRELCYHCGGRGENPQQPGQPCTTCNGTRYAPCRFCQSRGYLSCPTCKGRKGTTCTTCQGTGKMTQEITVTCGAETHFILKAGDAPSGLRKGFDRIGIANLGKGHADIVASPPSEEELEAAFGKPRIPILNYAVTIPYAEMRMGFGNKKAVVSVVGKRAAIIGVPNFLDASLQLWNDKLRQAALGKTPLSEALEVRALKEILSLTVSGKGYVENIRKLYPYGLSIDCIKSILNDMRLALNKVTLKTRALIAVLCTVVCLALFYVVFAFGIETQLTIRQGRLASFIFDLVLLSATLSASWAILNFSTRFVLQRRFPQLKLALQQKIGKTGYSMLGGIILAFVACILLSPIKPLWLISVLH